MDFYLKAIIKEHLLTFLVTDQIRNLFGKVVAFFFNDRSALQLRHLLQHEVALDAGHQLARLVGHLVGHHVGHLVAGRGRYRTTSRRCWKLFGRDDWRMFLVLWQRCFLVFKAIQAFGNFSKGFIIALREFDGIPCRRFFFLK